MNKRLFIALLAFPFILAYPNFTRANNDFDVNAFDFNFDDMPKTPEKSNLEKLRILCSLSSMILHKEVINPADELFAEYPHLLALASVGVYTTRSVSGWKKIIYTFFPYLLLRGILKKIEQSRSA